MAELKKVNYIAIHCSATKANVSEKITLPGEDIGAKEIDRWHRQRGFFKIGYHFVIRRDGTLEYGRKLAGWNGATTSEVGAHVSNFNSQSIGICMVGGLDENGKAENNFEPAQWETLSWLVHELVMKYPKTIVQGHRDFPKVAKDCPCFDVKAWWKSLR